VGGCDGFSLYGGGGRGGLVTLDWLWRLRDWLGGGGCSCIGVGRRVLIGLLI